MKDNTVYRLRFRVRQFSDSDSNGMMRLEELKSWAPMFMSIDRLKEWAKDDATKEWINNFMKESGGEEVFDEDGKLFDLERTLKNTKTISDLRAGEMNTLKKKYPMA